MLPPAHRLRASSDFRATTRSGRRAASRTLVAHVRRRSGEDAIQVGVIVSKGVGNAVTRNRVKRRLRHLVIEHLDGFPASSQLVLRALPAAADATSAELRADLSRAVRWLEA